jgi:hypothetical protein
VTVEVALLERAAFPSPVLAVGLILAIVGVGLAIRAAPAGTRLWSLLCFFAPVAALVAWHLLQLHSELLFTCVSEPGRTASRLIAVSAGIGALAFVQLAVTLTLRAWKRELSVLWPVVLLSSSLCIAGGVGWHKRSLQREFESRLRAVMPVPNVLKASQPPEAHVGYSRDFMPDVQAAGRSVGFFFTSRVAMSGDDRKAWGIDRIVLTPEREGVNVVPLLLKRDLVSVEAELEVMGVRDEGPVWFPLAKGNRWEFVGVRGRGGALQKLISSLERGKKPVPEPSLTLEVTQEGERDGLHFFELTETQKGATTAVRRLIRRNGELFEGPKRVAFDDERQGCHLTLLQISSCTCVEERLHHCSVVHGDVGESLLRLFLGAVTLGITEVMGMGDLGAGNEAALLVTKAP